MWEKGTSKSPEIIALVCMVYFCAAHNNFNICVQYIPDVRNNIIDASHFQHHHFRQTAPNATPHPDIFSAWPHQTFIAASYSVDISVPQSTWQIYQSGLNAYLLFCSYFKIIPIPVSSLTLLYLWIDKSQSVSYKTLTLQQFTWYIQKMASLIRLLMNHCI